ncbi:MAG: Co2+/Mg2+ efflux protein ApaG [Gammaproteobacteria bacterium]|nr:Co2+/Mg2+ efflux protein ApaG [Gammaproteobacteria bacterium]MDH5728738.1 Co2+/Mg2+ efflux protein ApaG [Gammaproteobacteria bacterium]
MSTEEQSLNTQDSVYLIRVEVKTSFIEEQSAPELNRYVFAYTITIINEGNIAARLITRHWTITDALGNVQEVRGVGVVGEQPFLKPGESFQYTSGTVLETPVGSMEGTYQMIADDETEFAATVPAFTLSIPHALH